MDESHTKQMLDALADLFLSDPPPPEGRPQARRYGASPSKAGGLSSSGSHGASAARDQDPLAAPAPIRLPPKLAAIPRPDSDDDTVRAPGAHPYRRTWREPRPAHAAPAVSSDLRIEAVFLGNLPGFSGPWLTQYAHCLAQERGAVALLRVDEEQIDLELVAPPAHLTAVRQSSRLAAVQRAEGLPAALEALAGSPRPLARTILIHLPVPGATPGGSLITQIAQQVPRWTVVCGADEAAAIGSYRWLKHLVGSGNSEGGDAGAIQRRQVGVMIMGSDPDKAQATATRMAEAARNFLHAPLQFLGAQKQMVPVSTIGLGSYPGTAENWPAAWAQLRNLAEAAGAWDSAGEGASGPLRLVDAETRLRGADHDEAPELDEAVDPPPVSSVAEALGEAPASKKPTAAAAAAPAPAVEPETATPADDDKPDLSSFLPGLGAVPLQARCPAHEQTQIVLDESGRLHLLRRHAAEDAAGGKPGMETSLRAAIVDLIEARLWVREHLRLIQLTQRQCHFDPAAEPVLHLFTDQAKTATALAARLGTFLRLHLLQPVRVGDQSTWFCVDLN